MKKLGTISKLFSLLFLIVLFSNSITVNAYRTNGYKFSYPRKISYRIGPNLGQYDIAGYMKKWCNLGPNIGFSSAYTEKPSIVFSKVDFENGTYATTTHKDNNHHSIIFYKSFFNTKKSYQNETIVHEVGHALGLAHTAAPVNPSKAVMRATGFNNKAYPLADDIAGIKSLYK